jgi:ribosome maturation factor RimP
MLSDALRERIAQRIGETLPEAFLVDMELRPGGQRQLVIKVDTDPGITIDECAKLSRAVGHLLETDPEMDFSYVLEVSSPGVGSPLKLHRQYVKNIGRNMKVRLHDLRELRGIVQSVSDTEVVLQPIAPGPERPKPGQPAPEAIHILFSDILESKIFL